MRDTIRFWSLDHIKIWNAKNESREHKFVHGELKLLTDPSSENVQLGVVA